MNARHWAPLVFSDHDVGVQILKDAGLIPSSMVCCNCGSQISWCVDTSVKGGYWRRCLRAISASLCHASTSVRHGSWFQQITWTLWIFCSSRTSFAAFLLTLSRQEHQFGSATITDWAKLCREVMPPATDIFCDITYYIATNPLRSIHVALGYFRLG
jgi:hypothetical protein